MAEFVSTNTVSGVAFVTLDNSSASVNTVSPAWIEEMVATFEALKADDEVRGVVITSAKPSFMAGADLKFILEHASGLSAEQAFAFSQCATSMHRLIETCGKPVVAALNGFALGGGYELALACTHRIIVDDHKAVVGLPEVTVGLLPGSGGTQRLPRLAGVPTAVEVLIEGRTYGPAKALELGLVDAVVPAGELLEAARNWLDRSLDPVRPWDRKGFKLPESDGLLKQSTAALFMSASAKLLARYGSNYPAPISILTCIFEGVQVPFETGLRIESRHFARLLTGKVSRNMIRTTFVNKGLAERGARRPEGVPKANFTKVGVLGAGMMGAGIAFVCATAGIDVILLDTTIEAAERGKGYSEKILSKDVAKEKTTEEQASAILGRITPTVDFSQLAGAQLVIEAVFEDTAIKARRALCLQYIDAADNATC
jgi:3-hydroxyacyl-CoA dehydrogenase / enoyl-CoA hydratase / 3-hydroxybutyryl-CoA epimerase